MSQVYLHIGLHKTGTTFLQLSVFPYIEGVTSFSHFNHITDLAKKNNHKLLISNEGFCGNPWKGNYYNEFEQQVINLKQLFPESAVIIGFREQLPIITSLYKQFIQRGGTREVDYLYNKENTGVLKHQDFLYVKKIEFLKQHFDQLFFYTQENLKKDPQTFIRQFCNFLGVPQNKVLTHLKTSEVNVGVKSINQVNILRTANLWSHRLSKIHPILSPNHKFYQNLHVTPRDLIQFKGMFNTGEIFEFDNKLQEFIKNYYREDWESTLKIINTNNNNYNH